MQDVEAHHFMIHEAMRQEVARGRNLCVTVAQNKGAVGKSPFQSPGPSVFPNSQRNPELLCPTLTHEVLSRTSTRVETPTLTPTLNTNPNPNPNPNPHRLGLPLLRHDLRGRQRPLGFGPQGPVRTLSIPRLALPTCSTPASDFSPPCIDQCTPASQRSPTQTQSAP